MILPYLQLPVAIGYGDGQDKTVIGKVQPVKISSYHEGYNDAGCFIYIDGQPIQIALSIEQLETQLRSYWAQLNQKSTIKTKLGIV